MKITQKAAKKRPSSQLAENLIATATILVYTPYWLAGINATVY